MNKLFIFSLITLALSGCANKKIDIKNSPCACNYNGEQLQKPTDEKEWFEYISLNKEFTS